MSARRYLIVDTAGAAYRSVWIDGATTRLFQLEGIAPHVDGRSHKIRSSATVFASSVHARDAIAAELTARERFGYSAEHTDAWYASLRLVPVEVQP